MNKKKMEKEIYSFNEILLKKGKKVCTLNNGYICNSDKADEIIRMFYKDDIELYESFFILCINNANKPIGFAKIGQGGLRGTIVDISIICKFAIDTLATGVIIAHNHPSGQKTPSSEDIRLTKNIKEALKIFNIRFIDHIILTSDGYYSFQDEGTL